MRPIDRSSYKIPNPGEGKVMRCCADGTGTEMGIPDLQAFASRPGRVHIVGMYQRQGVLETLAQLESRHFPSDTIAESGLVVHATVWKGIPWQIISVPVRALATVQEIAREFGLHALHTVPVILETKLCITVASLGYQRTDPEWAWFPLRLESVYTLEALSPSTKPIGPGRTRGGWG